MAAAALAAGCGSSQAGPAAVQNALEQRLRGRNLSYNWVVCVRTQRRFEGSAIFRCNVNFGEPHIVRYCAVLDEGELVTNREQPAMRCGRRARSLANG